MRTLLVSAVASLMTLALGCDSTPPLVASTGAAGNGQPTTTMQGGAGTTGAAGATMTSTGAAGAPGTGGITQPGSASPCDRPTGDRFRPSSLAELQHTIRGTWLLCSNLALFHQPQAGMFIGENDRYVFLNLVGGRLVPTTGLENKGHLEYIDTSSFNGSDFSVQVNFVSDQETTIIAAPPIFSDDPRLLIINNNGVETYTYAAVPSTP